MLDNNKRYKSICFDLDTNKVRQHFCIPNNKSLSTAYEQIKVFMKENNFKWRQGSVYNSISPMLEIEVHDLLKNMGKSLPWLSDCVRELDITDIGRTLSGKHLLSDTNTELITNVERTAISGKYEYIKASCKGETTLLVSDPRNIAAYIMHHPTDSFVLRSPEGKTVLSTYGMMIDACNDMPFLKSIVSEIEPMQARHQKPNIKLYASKDLHINSALSRSI